MCTTQMSSKETDLHNKSYSCVTYKKENSSQIMNYSEEIRKPVTKG